MIIQHNMAALNTNRQYEMNIGSNKKLAEKLSSGYKVNRAADDAAGLAISEKMRRQIRGLSQSAGNIQDGVGYVQTADGALHETQDILHRMNELAVKSANGTNSKEDRQYIDEEIQQLKSELDRIFSTTSFNDKKIWGPDVEDRIQIGTKIQQAVTFNSGMSRLDVNNTNSGVVPVNGYRFHADDQGVFVSWTGYNGQDYETEKIDWATLEENNYAFEMSNYFGADDGTNSLYDGNGNPVFKHRVSFTAGETTTLEDMIASIDGVAMQGYAYGSFWGRLENNDGTADASRAMHLNETGSVYAPAYVSNANGGRDFEAADDVFWEAADSAGNVLNAGSSTGNLIASPTAVTVEEARNSAEGWTFSFYMEGIGKVTATSSSVTYGAGDRSESVKGLWWKWENFYDADGVLRRQKAGLIRTTGTGTLGDVMAVLTGDKDSVTPGILPVDNGGTAENGYLQLNFTMHADTPYTYGNGITDTRAGSFSLRLTIDENDTEATVLQKIKNSLDNTTILDLYTNNATTDSFEIWAPVANNRPIEVPVWGGTCEFFVQGGTEAGQHITVQYDSLSIHALGLEDTNVLTEESSAKAIGQIKAALQEISTQRSTFGAYQNRLEHAYNVNKNTEENTQASESVIRDTDMAQTMVAYSNNNILIQAGQAMQAQANRMNEGVLSLLN